MNWRSTVNRFLRTFGFEVTRRGDPAIYTECVPFGYFTYSPWFEPWFQDIFKEIEEYTAVKEDRCYILHQFARHCLHLRGDFAECGVYRGGTAMLLARVIRGGSAEGRPLHLFDSFEGMPESANADPSSHTKGDFGDTSLVAIRQRLSTSPFTTFNPGLIPETLTAVEDRRFAFVHVDVDLYQSTRDCVEFFYPRTVPGGIIVCDDYGAPAYVRSAKLAIDEFFEGRPEAPISLRTGQCFIIKQ